MLAFDFFKVLFKFIESGHIYLDWHDFLVRQIALNCGRKARDVVSYARKKSLWAAKPFQRSVKILDRFSGPSSFQFHDITRIIGQQDFAPGASAKGESSMRFKLSALIALLCLATFFTYGQTRKPRKPAPKPPVIKQEKEQPVFEDIGNGFFRLKQETLTFDHSLEGRLYYILDVACNATADDTIFTYVVKFDEQTPAGRSSLNTARELSRNFALYPDQIYYIRTMQIMCEIKEKESSTQCYELYWTDEAGNPIAKCPSPTFSERDNLNFIKALLVDSHVNPEGMPLIAKLGGTAKQLWVKARKAAKS